MARSSLCTLEPDLKRPMSEKVLISEPNDCPFLSSFIIIEAVLVYVGCVLSTYNTDRLKHTANDMTNHFQFARQTKIISLMLNNSSLLCSVLGVLIVLFSILLSYLVSETIMVVTDVSIEVTEIQNEAERMVFPFTVASPARLSLGST